MASTGAENAERKHQSQHCSDVEKVGEGPKPMRNYKPSKTTPNSADHFEESHQMEYEARERRSLDRVERVHRHNTAYPVLRDELDRRRSTTRVTAFKLRRGMNDDYVCSVCLKLNRQKNNLKSRYHGRGYRQYKSREKAYRRRRRRREIDKDKKYNRREILSKQKNFSKIHNWHPSIGKRKKDEESICQNENKSGSDIRSLKNPSTAEPSVTSYHSFPSLDHEPMVS